MKVSRPLGRNRREERGGRGGLTGEGTQSTNAEDDLEASAGRGDALLGKLQGRGGAAQSRWFSGTGRGQAGQAWIGGARWGWAGEGSGAGPPGVRWS